MEFAREILQTKCCSAGVYYLTLTLLMPRILADHPNHAIATDNLAVAANFLY